MSASAAQTPRPKREDRVSFGFRTVALGDKQAMVDRVFDQVARRASIRFIIRAQRADMSSCLDIGSASWRS